MHTTKKQIKISAPASKVMKFISDPKNMAIVIPNVIRNYNISKMKPGAGFSFDWEFSMVGIPFSGKWKIIEYEFPKKYVAETKGMISSKWTYIFSERNDITTWKAMVEYEAPKQAITKLAEKVLIKMNEKDLERFLHNVKVILEQ